MSAEGLDEALGALAQGAPLRGALLEAAFDAIMDGHAGPEQIKAFLIGTVPQMADSETLAAGARALRARMVRVRAPADAIDMCGTGGDGAATLNISTTAAFVVAGCGVPVAKHGNRAMTSRSGAADVLEALGVRLTADPEALSAALEQAKVAFLFAQNHHPAMRHVAQARREIGRRTIFNLLGPLSNPAGVRRQIVGVFAAEFAAPVREALAALGAERALVVHGAGGVDELMCGGGNRVHAYARDMGERIDDFLAFDPGLEAAPIEALRGGDAAHNAQALRGLLEGRDPDGAYARTALVNAAGGLIVAGAAHDWREGIELARASLVEGRALAALEALIALMREAK